MKRTSSSDVRVQPAGIQPNLDNQAGGVAIYIDSALQSYTIDLILLRTPERAGEPPVDLKLMLHSNSTMDGGSCDCRVLQRVNQYKYLGVPLSTYYNLVSGCWRSALNTLRDLINEIRRRTVQYMFYSRGKKCSVTDRIWTRSISDTKIDHLKLKDNGKEKPSYLIICLYRILHSYIC
ncbi:hypothetical protein J6590_101652 [Homalodisca vitripennis]|nr:hypothetical protein J6590_101652 [Homalodisca vitripennis]